MHVLLAIVALTLTPSALSASHAHYNGATVTVSGVAEHVYYGTGRHQYVRYDLCDASAKCVQVVHFGAESVAAEQPRTDTGTFELSVFVGDRHVLNAIVIGRP